MTAKATVRALTSFVGAEKGSGKVRRIRVGERIAADDAVLPGREALFVSGDVSDKEWAEACRSHSAAAIVQALRGSQS